MPRHRHRLRPERARQAPAGPSCGHGGAAFIFGHQYPRDECWRPVLAFGLLFAALAPVLFAGQKRNLTIIFGVVAAYLLLTLYLSSAPVLAFGLAMLLVLGLLVIGTSPTGQGCSGSRWPFRHCASGCLWGGSVWSPIVAMAGFRRAVCSLPPRLALSSGWRRRRGPASLWPCCGGFSSDGPVVEASALGLPVGFCMLTQTSSAASFCAIVIGVTGITFSLPIGILLALGRQSDMPIVKTLCVVFIETIRGVPLITLLFVAAFVLGFFLPPGTNFDLYSAGHHPGDLLLGRLSGRGNRPRRRGR